MLYTVLSVLVALAALLIGYRAVKLLLLSSWFVGWLKGMFGLSLLGLAVGVGVLAFDIYSYKQIKAGQSVATVNIESVGEQKFDVVVVDSNGIQRRYPLAGDQWQLDVRMIEFKGYFSTLNLTPAFRLDRLSGRFYDIQKESSSQRPHLSVVTSPLGLDFWRFIYAHPKWFPVLGANYGSVKYWPMKTGALYGINLTVSGLTVVPLNDVAVAAVSEWK
jgi:hypothetical protein